VSHKKRPDFYADAPVVSREEARKLGLAQFFTGEKCHRGHLSPRYTRKANCVMCSAEDSLAWQKQAYLHFGGEEYREHKRNYRINNPLMHLLSCSKSRAKKKGHEFTITAADLVMPESCPCCGGKIAMRSGPTKQGPLPTSPSIDRFDNNLGYVPGNVSIICWRCNELKRNATVDELRKIIAWIEGHQSKQKLTLVS
jgi:hypothetical protein